MADAHHPPADLTWIGQDKPIARRVGQPVARFLAIESASGLLLIVATIAALVWANSPWSHVYEDLLHVHIGFEIGSFHLQESLLHWVNDGLMALFFFVVGLEIKRELVTGELRDPRAALLPAVAAAGGMVVPAAIFLFLAPDGAGASGWGIPMATDIAFALGVVSLLGKRVPTPLKIFLLTLAIVDDIGAIVVIAIFYTSDLAIGWLGVAVGLLVAIGLLQRAKVWYTPIYVVIGTVCWFAMLESGIHATIAGVALGILTPARPLQRRVPATSVLETIVDGENLDGHSYRRADLYIRECVSVAERLQTLLHPFTSFVVIPIFALANAGIVLSAAGLRDAMTSGVTLGVVVGLVAGKALGITLASFLAVRSGACSLPRGVTWPQIFSVATLAGIGFTVALFIAGLAYTDAQLVTEAKMGILVASMIAGVLGAVLLKRSTTPPPDDLDDESHSEGPDQGLFSTIADRLEPISDVAHSTPAPTQLDR